MADRDAVHLGRLAAAALAVVVAACSSPAVVVSPSPTASTRRTGNATFYFEPGAVRWCGAFVSYRAPSTTASGELNIGPTTFMVSSGNPAPFAQRVGTGVQPGSWVCLGGTVVRSETAANLLTDFTVEPAPIGSTPPGPIRATPCGLITDVFVTDIPSGGFITLSGTKFLVGGARLSSDAVQLPPATELRLGVPVCITGTSLTAQDPSTFTAVGGRVTVTR